MYGEPGADTTADLGAALARLRRYSGLPVAFGGLQAGQGRYRLNSLAGTATAALRGLDIHHGNGVGGKAVALRRPFTVTDYHASAVISHEYDAVVATEGLRSVVAAPVVVRRRVRGVLYGALRTPVRLGDGPLSAVMDAARELEEALLLQDEAARLLAAARQPAAGPARWEEVREAHGDLRALAQRVTDPLLRQELLTACGRLAAASPDRVAPADRALAPGGEPAPSAAAEPPSLSPREVDVLVCVAAGAANAEAARRLGLRPETVKSYLRSAMRKLGAHSRMQAVIAARRSGLLP